MSPRIRGVFTSRYRRALTRTALNAVTAGLPVVPGAWWSATGGRFDCDVAECRRTGPHPAVDTTARNGGPGSGDGDGVGLSRNAVHDLETVSARWRQRPYAVLIATGETCDVVDVPAALGRRLAVRLDARSQLGPVIAAGPRWFFLTTSGGRLPVFGGDVLVHGKGSWIMLPPSLGPGGEPARWLVRPAGCSWSRPSRDDVIRGLALPSVPAPRSVDRIERLDQISPTPA